MWYKNIAGRFFGLVTKHACDRRTDGQNHDSQDRASIAALHVKNGLWVHQSPGLGSTVINSKMSKETGRKSIDKKRKENEPCRQ